MIIYIEQTSNLGLWGLNLILSLMMIGCSKEEKEIDFDERKNPIMTSRTLMFYCEKEGGLSTP